MSVRKSLASVSIAIHLIGVPAQAEAIGLGDYLDSLNQTEVTFQGYIYYSELERFQGDFTFYNAERVSFPVTMDAGRKTRERIEKECSITSFGVDLNDMCEISGLGTVEIRRSRIHLSIDEVVSLKAP